MCSSLGEPLNRWIVGFSTKDRPWCKSPAKARPSDKPFWIPQNWRNKNSRINSPFFYISTCLGTMYFSVYAWIHGFYRMREDLMNPMVFTVKCDSSMQIDHFKWWFPANISFIQFGLSENYGQKPFHHIVWSHLFPLKREILMGHTPWLKPLCVCDS